MCIKAERKTKEGRLVPRREKLWLIERQNSLMYKAGVNVLASHISQLMIIVVSLGEGTVLTHELFGRHLSFVAAALA